MVKFKSINKKNLYKILTTPTYTIAEASQLVGVSRGRISRWLMGYEYTYKVKSEMRDGKQDSVVNQSEQPQTSFLDLIDLLFVNRFIEHGFTLQFLRQALEEARRLLGTPHFARNKFFTHGKQITLELNPESKYMIALMTGGQSAMSEIVEQFDDKIEFEDVTGFGLANRWYPRGKEGLIVIDPQISFGRPTIIGRGVATENIYDLYLGEKKKIDPVSNWYKIPRDEINAAILFQTSLVGV